ncbi:MAG: NADH-quinone oxidoreductase subunit J [Acidobacteria bacterium]|nr:NADH-quinone oxidoreductase subunit J [Acidobacteriota bacterium]
MPETLQFYLFAALAIGASALVIGQRNPMHSVLLLIASFGALAGLYVLLDAPFVAVAQIIIYAGAIMVLFLFVVMLLNAPQEDAHKDPFALVRQSGLTRVGAVLALLLLLQLSWALLSVSGLAGPVDAGGDAAVVSSVPELGRVLFTDYMFAFEATSVLILVAMVGAVVLAGRRENEE